MTDLSHPCGAVLAAGHGVALHRIAEADLPAIGGFPFTVSIREPLDDLPALAEAFARTGFWQPDAGAVAVREPDGGRLLGTLQFYRAAPCIHGFEMGYILHDAAERGRGVGSEAVRLLRDLLFETFADIYRLQLIIETWNVASWKLAERCGFVREGLLRSAGFGAGDPPDCFVYAQTRKDWSGSQHRPVSLGGAPADA